MPQCCAHQLFNCSCLRGHEGVDMLPAMFAPCCLSQLVGPDFGLKYALNTPANVGCSGAVAAITAYKATLQPMGLPRPGMFLPLPIAVVGLLYCCLYIREKVRCPAAIGLCASISDSHVSTCCIPCYAASNGASACCVQYPVNDAYATMLCMVPCHARCWSAQRHHA